GMGLHPPPFELDGIGDEAIGLDDIRAGLEIGPVNLLDNLGLSHAENVVAPQEVVRMVAKALAAKVGLLEIMAHEHRTHGTVEDHDPLRQDLLEATTCVVHGDVTHSETKMRIDARRGRKARPSFGSEHR